MYMMCSDDVAEGWGPRACIASSDDVALELASPRLLDPESLHPLGLGPESLHVVFWGCDSRACILWNWGTRACMLSSGVVTAELASSRIGGH